MQSYNRASFNIDNKNQSIKAGRNRWLGKGPTVRVVMNPVDHHGGGEGKTSGDETRHSMGTRNKRFKNQK